MRAIQLVACLLLALAPSALAGSPAVIGVNTSHGDDVESIALSADGAYIVTAANDFTIRVWQRESGRLIRSLSLGEAKYGAYLRYLYVADDGSYLAARATDDRTRLWRVADGELLLSNIPGDKAAALPFERPLGASFSPSNKRFAIGDSDKLAVYDLASLKQAKKVKVKGLKLDYGRMRFYGEGSLAVFDRERPLLHVFTLPSLARRELPAWRPDEGTVLGRKAIYSVEGAAVWALDPASGAQRAKVLDWKGDASSVLYSESRNELYLRERNALYRVAPGGREKLLDFMKLDYETDQTARKLFDPETGVYVVGLSSGLVLASAPWSGAALPLQRPVGRIRSLDVSASGTSLLVGFAAGGGALWDLGRIGATYLRPPKPALVNSVALSADGSRAALGGDGSHIFDARSGELLESDDMVCFGLGYDKASGSLGMGNMLGSLVVYEPRGFSAIRFMTRAHERIDAYFNKVIQAGCNAVVFSPKGDYLLSAGADYAVRLWDPKTGRKLWESGKGGDFGGGGYHADVSRDGERFATDGDRHPRVWEARGKRLLADFAVDAEVSALCFSPDGKLLYVGLESGFVEARAAEGGKLVSSFLAHGGDVNGIRFAKVKGEDVLVTGGLDGALKLWSEDRREPILTAYAFEGGDWAVVTPDGYWDASARGGSLVNMVDGMRAYGIDQFAARTNRPDIVAERLGAPAELVDLFRSQYRKRLAKLGLDEASLASGARAPKAAIASAARQGRGLSLELAFSSAGPELAGYQIYANDVPLFGSAGKSLSGASAAASEALELVPGENKIEVSCFDRSGAESYRVPALFKVEEASEPDLYFLGLGVSQYDDRDIPDLSYAAADALSLSRAFAAMEGRGFRKVRSLVLTDKQVVKGGLSAAQGFMRESRPEDVFVLFVAGHGIQLAKGPGSYEYYYVTADARLSALAERSIPFADIEAILGAVAPRQKLFLIDTCQSGEAEAGSAASVLASARGARARVLAPESTRGLAIAPQAVGNAVVDRDRFIWNDLARRSGAIVFSACRADEASLESDAWKQGAFTQAILEAFAAKPADKDRDGRLSVDELRAYVSAAVPKKVRELDPEARQHPVVDRDNIYVSFGFPAAR